MTTFNTTQAISNALSNNILSTKEVRELIKGIESKGVTEADIDSMGDLFDSIFANPRTEYRATKTTYNVLMKYLAEQFTTFYGEEEGQMIRDMLYKIPGHSVSWDIYQKHFYNLAASYWSNGDIDAPKELEDFEFTYGSEGMGTTEVGRFDAIDKDGYEQEYSFQVIQNEYNQYQEELAEKSAVILMRITEKNPKRFSDDENAIASQTTYLLHNQMYDVDGPLNLPIVLHVDEPESAEL